MSSVGEKKEKNHGEEKKKVIGAKILGIVALVKKKEREALGKMEWYLGKINFGFKNFLCVFRWENMTYYERKKKEVWK